MKRMKQLKDALAERGVLLLAKACDRALVFACENSSRGHSYRIAVLEGGLMDPTARCAGCDLMLTDEAYARITNVYAAAMAEEVW